MSRLSEKIKKARKSAGLTQRMLADMIHLSQGYIGDIERGRTNPSLSTLELIANALQIDIAEFVGNSSEVNETSITNDEIYLLMGYRDLADNDKITVQNLISRLKLVNKNKTVKSSTSLTTANLINHKRKVGLVSGRV